jgi:hypothetical protein
MKDQKEALLGVLTAVPGRMKALANSRKKLNNFADRNRRPTPAKACAIGDEMYSSMIAVVNC